MVHPLTDAYNAGYQEAIDKACEWLLKNIDQDYIYNKGGYRNIKGWVNDFRKTMEE